MRRAAIAVVAVLLALALGDLVFTRVVERTAAGELERRTDAGAASVDVRSFPLVDSLVRRGEVREVTVRLEDVVSNGVPLTEVTLTGEDVRVDRTDAVQGDLRITRLGRIRSRMNKKIRTPMITSGMIFPLIALMTP